MTKSSIPLKSITVPPPPPFNGYIISNVGEGSQRTGQSCSEGFTTIELSVIANKWFQELNNEHIHFVNCEVFSTLKGENWSF